MRDELLKFFEKNGVEYRVDVNLKERSTFRIGGICALGLFPDSVEKAALCIRELRKMEEPFFIVGRGSNILFGDGVTERALIFTERLRGISREGNTVYAEAGVTLASLAAFAAKEDLCGLEFAAGIPGSVGGAVYMNAGAYGGEMSGVVSRSVAYDSARGKMLDVVDHGFGYRRSVYMDNADLTCLAAEFSLTEGDGEQIRGRMRELAAKRREKQPLEYPSCGSYFKRPEGHFAGKLIEDAGLKGARVGGACVSEKHAGFIVNLGGATAEDVLKLEALVTETVREKFGVTLEREVRVIPD